MMWYVVLTKPRQEARAQQQLEQQGIEVFLPMLGRIKQVRGKRKEVFVPLFPGYLFIHLTSDSALLSKVRSTLGVRHLLMFAGKVMTVDASLIADLKQRCAALEQEDVFIQGQAVNIVGGPFLHYQAIFKDYDGEERAIIWLSLLNQQNELIVQLNQLARV